MPMLSLFLLSAILLHTPRHPSPTRGKLSALLLRNHARPLRLILLVLHIVQTMHAAYGHYFENPPIPLHDEPGEVHEPNMYNFTVGSLGALVIGKGIELATLERAPRLVFSDPEEEAVEGSSDHGKHNQHDQCVNKTPLDSSRIKTGRRPPRPFFFPHTWVPLCIDLATNCSGFGWEWCNAKLSKAGYATVVPPRHRFDRQGLRWLATRTFLMVVQLILFYLTALMISQPRFLAAFDQLPKDDGLYSEPYRSSRLATGFIRGLLAIISGSIGIATIMEMEFCAASIVHFLLDPRAMVYWDVLPFGNFLASTSLHQVWGKEWHGMMRRVWYFVAYRPTFYVTRRVLRLPRGIAASLAVMALFGLSGISHEIGLFNMRQGVDGHAPLLPPDTAMFTLRRMRLPDCSPIDPKRRGFGANNFSNTKFFVSQGVGILLERAFTLFTHKKVGGMMGWLWTWVWLIYCSGGLYYVS